MLLSPKIKSYFLTVPYYLWNTYFTVKTLTAEAMEAGFKISGLYSDVAGNNYQKNSATIAILLEK